jgi:hypothetical protein
MSRLHFEHMARGAFKEDSTASWTVYQLAMCADHFTSRSGDIPSMWAGLSVFDLYVAARQLDALCLQFRRRLASLAEDGRARLRRGLAPSDLVEMESFTPQQMLSLLSQFRNLLLARSDMHNLK